MTVKYHSLYHQYYITVCINNIALQFEISQFYCASPIEISQFLLYIASQFEISVCIMNIASQFKISVCIITIASQFEISQIAS